LNPIHIHTNFKVKVKLPLRLTKHHTMKRYWGVEVSMEKVVSSVSSTEYIKEQM
jgi:hypothetical protein